MVSCYTTLVSDRQDLRDFDFSYADLQGADFRGKILYSKTSFQCADLRKAILTGLNLDKSCFDSAKLDHAVLDGSSFVGADFESVSLKNASLKGAILQNATFGEANLNGADLTDADLTGANLSGASLRRVNLSRVRGIGTKEGEIAFAKSTLWAIETEQFELDMEYWHHPSIAFGDENCRTAHCIAGWAFPDEEVPGQKASLLYPTLAQYFFSSNEEAMNALRLVAAGKLSVFPD